MADAVQLNNREVRLGDGLVGQAHARLDEGMVIWSASVSGPGVKAWSDGRSKVKDVKGETDEAKGKRLRTEADEFLAPEIEVLAARVRAGLAVKR